MTGLVKWVVLGIRINPLGQSGPFPGQATGTRVFMLPPPLPRQWEAGHCPGRGLHPTLPHGKRTPRGASLGRVKSKMIKKKKKPKP